MQDYKATFDIPLGVESVWAYWLYCPFQLASNNGAPAPATTAGYEKYYNGPLDDSSFDALICRLGWIPHLSNPPTILWSRANKLNIVPQPGDFLQVGISLAPFPGKGQSGSPQIHSAQWQIPGGPDDSGIVLQQEGPPANLVIQLGPNPLPGASNIQISLA